MKDEKDGEKGVVTLILPDIFLDLCKESGVPPATVLGRFIADLCDLEEGRELSTSRMAALDALRNQRKTTDQDAHGVDQTFIEEAKSLLENVELSLRENAPPLD